MFLNSIQAASIAVTLTIFPLAYALPKSIIDLKPRDIQSAIPGLPACNTKETDPSYAVGTSAWQDGQGHYLGRDCERHDHECWTDYFLIGTTSSYNSWYQAIGNIQCSGDCHEDIGALAQSCTSNTWEVSESISAGFDLSGVKLGSTTTVTVGGSVSNCDTKSDSASCRWTDSLCHSIWAAQQITTVHGYTRRSCKHPTNKAVNMPNTAVRPDGHYTRGMLDFEVKLPAMNAIDCKGTCDPIWTPGALPQIDTTLHPMV